MNINFRKKFSRRLENRRTELGLTQEQIALALNMTRSAYSNYELGRSVPTMETFISLAKLLDVAPGDLLPMETVEMPKVPERPAQKRPLRHSQRSGQTDGKMSA